MNEDGVYETNTCQERIVSNIGNAKLFQLANVHQDTVFKKSRNFSLCTPFSKSENPNPTIIHKHVYLASFAHKIK